MRLEINVRKEHILFLVIAVFSVMVIRYASGYGTNDPSSFGHSASEIDLPGAIMAFYATSCPDGWKPADGTDNTPDLRGVFLRGLNDFGSGTRNDGNQDPDGASRAPGDFQRDEMQSHSHDYIDKYDDGPTTHVEHDNDGASYEKLAVDHSAMTDDPVDSGSGAGEARHGMETRPKNVGVIFCVKDQ